MGTFYSHYIMKLKLFCLVIVNLIEIACFAEIPSSDLVGLWKDKEGKQFLFVNEDLSWKAKMLQDDREVYLEGKLVITTKGEEEKGTMVVFMKQKGDNRWTNISLVLGTKDETLTDKTLLQYDDLILQKDQPAQ